MAWDLQVIKASVSEAYSKSGLSSYWVQEEPSVIDAIAAISESIDSKRFNQEKILRVGGSGIVIRLQDSKFPKVDKALKFPRPVPGKVALVAELLNREIQYLAEIRHPRIIRVLDYNCLNDIGEYHILPFYLMDYIDGDESRNYVKTHPKRIISIIESLADILRYLHTFPDGGFAHLDIKPDNFVVQSDGRVIMIDLGTCKRLADSRDSTTIACTRSFAHPELVRRLTADPSDENRAKGDIPRNSINPKWDLWAFALTVLSWLGLDHQSGQTEYMDVLNHLDSYTRKYLFLLAARIVGGPNCPNWLTNRVGLSSKFLEEVPISTAHELCELIGRLSGSVNTIQQIPELSPSQTNTIQAAPSQHIVITPAVKKVLENRLFRRLNSITQLGMVSQVYPSAKHSRKEHCLGTYANVCRMVKALYDDQSSPLFRQLFNAKEIRTLLLTSLLHDLGQFPLAHDLEEIDKRIFDHGDLTIAAFKGAWDKKQKGFRKISFDSLEPIFNEWGVASIQILGLLSAKAKNISASVKDKLLRSLLSGPIDADKLDYLLRDGRQLDLPYPMGVDVERIFVCITTVVITRLEGGYTDIPVLGIQAKGKVSADFLTLARYAMFSQAYWHHTVRAQKAMLFRAVGTLIAKQNSAPKLRKFQSDFVEMVVGLPESLYLYTPSQKTLFDTNVVARPTIGAKRGSNFAATDAAVLSWFYERLRQAKQPEAKLIDRILSRDLFKRLWVISKEMEPTNWEKILSLWGQLKREQRHKVAHNFEELLRAKLIKNGYKDVTTMTEQTASDSIDRMTRGYVPWLLIDIPSKRPGSDVPLFYVLEGQRRSLRKDDRSVGSLQKSVVWDQYANKLLDVAGKVRVFCDPEFVDSVEASIDWREGVEVLITSLEQTLE